MEFFLFLLGGFGVMVLSYLLVIVHMRRKNGIQPSYSGFLLMLTTSGCVLAGFYALQRYGLDVRQGQPRDILWLVLGLVWFVLAGWTAYQRQSSGTVLMDLGRTPMFKLQMSFSILMAALAIGLAITPGSRAQAFAYIMWSAWFFMMARGRFQVRERGITSGSLLPWNRITMCVAMAENRVRLNLSKGFQRTVDLKLPADRRDEFIQLVSQQKNRFSDSQRTE